MAMQKCNPKRKISSSLALTFLLALLLLSCTAFAQTSKPTKDIVVLFQEDSAPANSRPFVQLPFSGHSFDGACSYYELLQKAKDTAAKLQANLMKIVSKTPHSPQQKCDSITVDFYNISKPTLYENSFSWSKERPLTWDDFKGKQRQNAGSIVVAETNCGIALETSLAGLLADAHIYVFNTFDKRASWVKPDKKLPTILEHEQGHWDICELYTRELQQRFDALQIKGVLMSETINHIYEQVTKEYEATQQRYENETQHGQEAEQQAIWTNRIQEALENNVTSGL